MSSTTVFKGSFGDKPSSRVLRPPGGGSSNIFGFSDESPQPVNVKATESPKVTEPPKAFALQTIEVGKEEMVSAASPATKEVAKEASRMSGVTEEQLAQQPSQSATSSKFRNSGFNPITGEAYPNAKVQPTAEDKKQKSANIIVKQPPGGASSGLW